MLNLIILYHSSKYVLIICLRENDFNISLTGNENYSENCNFSKFSSIVGYIQDLKPRNSLYPGKEYFYTST